MHKNIVFNMPEHPEHPGREHPGKEHPTKEHPGKEISLDDLAKTIEDFVKMDSELKGGYFLIYDTATNKPLALKLQRVHKDRLSKVSENKYFACADFISSEGKLYDLDFFIGSMHDQLKVTEISIHKEQGVPRYNWVEEGGIWKKVKI